jgi:5'-deoxynucleotidase YfbR-like HD superfamily hydrolase
MEPSQSPEGPRPDPAAVVNFMHELAQLGDIPRSGWRRIGAPQELVAVHVLGVAQLAYILAVMEGHPNPDYVTTLAVFHENTETRHDDPNALTKRYTTIDSDRVASDQAEPLGSLGQSILSMWRETEHAQTPAGKIAKDADKLQMAFRARTLMARGFDDAKAFTDVSLYTASARALHAALMEKHPNDWFKEVLSTGGR